MWWYEVVGLCLLAILAILTVLATAFLGVVFVTFVGSGRIRPLVAAIATGFGTFILVSHIPILPPMISCLMLPVIAASIAAGAAMTRSDWMIFGVSAPQDGSSTTMGLVGIGAGLMSGYLLSLTSFGKWVLNCFGQAVIGSMPSEVREIRVAGAICGFFVGCFSAIVIWRLAVSRYTK